MSKVLICIILILVCVVSSFSQYDVLNKDYEKSITKEKVRKYPKTRVNYKRNINWKRYLKYYSRYSKSIAKWSKYYNLDSNIVKAVISWESNWSAKAGYQGCNGLMQVSGGSHNPDKNIRQGCSILAKNLKRFGNYYGALNAYNLGAGKWNRFQKKGYSYKYAERIMEITNRMLAHDFGKKVELFLGELNEGKILHNNCVSDIIIWGSARLVVKAGCDYQQTWEGGNNYQAGYIDRAGRHNQDSGQDEDNISAILNSYRYERYKGSFKYF